MTWINAFWRFLSTFTLILGLSACTPTLQLKPAHNPKQRWQHYRQHLQHMQRWQAQGIVGIRLPNQAQSANVIWQQQAAHYTIELYGPLGIGATYLKGSPGQVTLITHDNHHITASDAEQLMEDQLGWYVPVEGLVYWLRGLPAPGPVQSKTLNCYGLLKQLDQRNWHIQYSRYQALSHNLALPGKILMQRHDLHVTIIVRHWKDR